MSETLQVYGIAAGMLVLLLAFVRKNQRNGWQKEEKRYVMEMSELCQIWERMENTRSIPATPIAPMRPAPMNGEQLAGFSKQLLLLQDSLGMSTRIGSNVEATEKIPAR